MGCSGSSLNENDPQQGIIQTNPLRDGDNFHHMQSMKEQTNLIEKEMPLLVITPRDIKTNLKNNFKSTSDWDTKKQKILSFLSQEVLKYVVNVKVVIISTILLNKEAYNPYKLVNNTKIKLVQQNKFDWFDQKYQDFRLSISSYLDKNSTDKNFLSIDYNNNIQEFEYFNYILKLVSVKEEFSIEISKSMSR